MKTFELVSPDKSVGINLYLDGSLYYRACKFGAAVIETSKIGIVTDYCDFSNGLMFKHEERNRIDETYTIPAFKKKMCRNEANELVLSFIKDNHEMKVTMRAYNDGAAFKINLAGSNAYSGAVNVTQEMTEYRIPERAVAVYAQKLVFSYEDNYQPVPKEDLFQNPYAFPMLIELGENLWALYAEGFVYGNAYGGSNLTSSKAAPLVMSLQKAPDKLTCISGQLPFETPWRAVITGNLNDIVCSNLLENLNPAPRHDFSYVQGGVGAWSWIVDNSSGSNPERIKKDVDFAAQMNFPYTLIDAGWPGNVDIPEMVQYGKRKGVKIWIWEHSMHMADRAVAEEKMKLWSAWGIAGIKIDFFESDSQERIARHNMLADLAAECKLMLNFHGCSKPTGTSRVWPHVLTYEGVLGGEYLQNYSSFLPGGPDAAHHCTLPFTRNAVGPMDYTPLMLESFLTGTSDTHQVALTVIFTSYMQNLTEKADIVVKHPCVPFLKKIKAVWDETLLLEGAPANYVTMARRSGDEWFAAGICARRPRISSVKLDFLGNKQYKAHIYADDISGDRPFDHAIGAMDPPTPQLCKEMETIALRPSLHGHDMHKVRIWEMTVTREDSIAIHLCANGGFVIYFEPV